MICRIKKTNDIGVTIIRRFMIAISLVVVLTFLAFSFTAPVLTFLGQWLIIDEKPGNCDAAVVLNTGVEYYPRLIEAADLYGKGFVKKVVINGNRKSEALRNLEERGFRACCPWYEDRVRMLVIFGVPREGIMSISAEDAYDTVSEARAVGNHLIRDGFTDVLIITSKSHTRRASFIWKKMFEGRLTVQTVAAETDPYDPTAWWKQGRQLRWVLSEYGAWVYYWWKDVLGHP